MASLMESKTSNLETLEDEEEDDTEFLDGIVAQNIPENQAAQDKEYTEFKRFRSQVETAEERGISRKQILLFRALTELDEGRKDRIGIKPLFLLFCENGNSTWLNPGKGIGALEATLRKFSGDRKILIPIIELLIQIAEAKLSPAAFLKFIILPRLRGDMNWRNWEKSHFPAFRIIKNILTDVLSAPQFQSEILENGQLTLARDIVLAKYVGGPIAKLELNQIVNAQFQIDYATHWKNIQFNNYLALYFIKSNVLPILSNLSSKLDARQILALLSELPTLENAFFENYPDEIYSWKKLPNYALYPVSFHYSYNERIRLGYSIYEVYSEALGYTRIMAKILPTRAGIYLCELLAKKILRKGSNSFTIDLGRLIELIPDSGGLYTYRWHVERLIQLNADERKQFIDATQANAGIHPDFHRPLWMENGLLPGPFTVGDYTDRIRGANTGIILKQIAKDLKLDEYLQNKKEQLSISGFLKAYYDQNPNKKEIIEDYFMDIIKGQDREWTAADAKSIDSIHPEFQKVLLLTTLRGLGGTFSRFKSDSLQGLFRNFSEASHLPSLPYEISFEWEDTEKENKKPKDEVEIRKKINLALFESCIKALGDTTKKVTNDLLPIIGRELIQLQNSLSEKRNQLIDINEENQKLKIQNAIKHIEVQIKRLYKLRDDFVLWDKAKQLIFIIFYASKYADGEDTVFQLAVNLVLQFLAKDNTLASEMESILQDIVVDNLQSYQIDVLVSFAKRITDELLRNEKILAIFDLKDAIFVEHISPYSSLKKQAININALDAAMNKLFRVGKMQAEKAKWLDFLIKQTEEPKMRNYRIYTSKSFVDAYYGDMGGICLSLMPKEILRPNLYNFRIADETDGKIVGMFLLTYSQLGVKSLGISDFFAAFAINPLYSVLYHWSKKEKLLFYLWIRSLLEFISFTSGKPVFLAGRSSYGLLSEGSEFTQVIETTEKQFKSPKVTDAFSLDIYYNKQAYANAYMICDPMEPSTKHAHRLLKL
ncbi:MAG: hypothetical protein O9264_08040 [Leptospira sp.]|nr:hypothetical protein [Leptospira sp.]